MAQWLASLASDEDCHLCVGSIPTGGNDSLEGKSNYSSPYTGEINFTHSYLSKNEGLP